ncbi:MAG: hypothetical protein VYA84_21505 [Planctomycetota bacterium]|nr:hypothetical protein [Planctomycetota bacterium]
MRICIVLCLLGSLVVGCVHDGDSKTSHFEHDHEVAPHWPSDLADAADKLRRRLNAPVSEQSKQVAKEIADIVSWLPEIAADTNLSEQDWIPLDTASNSLSAKLQSTDNKMTDECRQQTVALCELIEQSLDKVPTQLPSLRDAGS